MRLADLPALGEARIESAWCPRHRVAGKYRFELQVRLPASQRYGKRGRRPHHRMHLCQVNL